MCVCRKETGGGEGVEILKNEPFEGKDFVGGRYTKGQYTYKIYHVETKLPKVIRYDNQFPNFFFRSLPTPPPPHLPIIFPIAQLYYRNIII